MVLAGHFTTWLDALNALAQENALGSREAARGTAAAASLALSP